MIKLGLRRHFGILEENWQNLIIDIEKVDNMLAESQAFRKTSPHIVVYGHDQAEHFLVGREVIGFDMDFMDHELIKVSHYGPVESEEIQIQDIGLLDFPTFFNHKLREFKCKNFRLEILHFESGLCYFY